MNKLSASILAVSFLAGFTGAAMAATASASLTVTATVSATCTATTTALNFGSYDPSSASANDNTGAVSVTCTNGTPYTVALNAGSNAGTPGDVTTRRMLSGSSSFLPYQIYTTAGRTTVWGDGANGSSTQSNTGSGDAQSFSAYGRIPAGQYVAPGNDYADSVTVTVTY